MKNKKAARIRRQQETPATNPTSVQMSTPEESNQALADMAKVISMKEAAAKAEAKKAKAPKKAAKPGNLTSLLPALPKNKTKKDRPDKPCECGCGGTTKSRFSPGHDSLMRGAAIRVEKGVMTLEQFEGILVKNAGKTREQAKAMKDAVEGELQKRKAEARKAKAEAKKGEGAAEATGTEE